MDVKRCPRCEDGFVTTETPRDFWGVLLDAKSVRFDVYARGAQLCNQCAQPFLARVTLIETDLLNRLFHWLEDPPRPPREGHVCGPDAFCDSDCEIWADFCKDWERLYEFMKDDKENWAKLCKIRGQTIEGQKDDKKETG